MTIDGHGITFNNLYQAGNGETSVEFTDGQNVAVNLWFDDRARAITEFSKVLELLRKDQEPSTFVEWPKKQEPDAA